MQSEQIKQLIEALRKCNLEKSASALDVLLSEAVSLLSIEWSYNVDVF